jgi:hypothetical protein
MPSLCAVEFDPASKNKANGFVSVDVKSPETMIESGGDRFLYCQRS